MKLLAYGRGHFASAIYRKRFVIITIGNFQYFFTVTIMKKKIDK